MGERITEDGRIEIMTEVNKAIDTYKEACRIAMNTIEMQKGDIADLRESNTAWRNQYYTVIQRVMLWWVLTIGIAVAASLYAGWFLWGAG